MTPMEQPMSLRCESESLRWDAIGRLWLCTHCGASLSYTSWSCGRKIDCRVDLVRKPPSLASRRLNHFRPQ